MNKKRLLDTFMELVKVGSESGKEKEFQGFLKKKCEQLGMLAYEDHTGKKTGLSAGNLICALEATADMQPLMFCCHSDTVKPGSGIEPVAADGIVRQPTIRRASQSCWSWRKPCGKAAPHMAGSSLYLPLAKRSACWALTRWT